MGELEANVPPGAFTFTEITEDTTPQPGIVALTVYPPDKLGCTFVKEGVLKEEAYWLGPLQEYVAPLTKDASNCSVPP